MPNVNYVSECCHRSTEDGINREFPLGGSTWSIAYKIKVCECCGKPCDEVEACEVCGVVGCGGDCESEGGEIL